jgi:hypothetical protein
METSELALIGLYIATRSKMGNLFPQTAPESLSSARFFSFLKRRVFFAPTKP